MVGYRGRLVLLFRRWEMRMVCFDGDRYCPFHLGNIGHRRWAHDFGLRLCPFSIEYCTRETDRIEKPRQSGMRGLDGTDHQPPSVDQAAGKIMNDCICAIPRKIHQHVATEDDVHCIGSINDRRIRIIHQIVIGKRDHPFDIVYDLVGLLDLLEIPIHNPPWCIAERPLTVHPLGTLLQPE